MQNSTQKNICNELLLLILTMRKNDFSNKKFFGFILNLEFLFTIFRVMEISIQTQLNPDSLNDIPFVQLLFSLD